ncbi:hypothetical protein CDIK_3491 [Cucumispora dikerogammari]|nr:hypothetical protein CDIK_3491 [Cucumispora dikerogammari]
MRKNNNISNEDKKRVCDSYANGNSIKSISTIIGIKVTTVHEIIKKMQRTGKSVGEKRGGSRESKLSPEQKICVKEWVDKDCSLSLRKLCAKAQEEFGINLSKSSVDRILSGFQYSLKRIHYISERQNNSGVIETRKVYALDYVALQSQFFEVCLFSLMKWGLTCQ